MYRNFHYGYKVYMIMVEDILEDSFFAAMAAIGFASISKVPPRTYILCGSAAAVGHGLRYALMSADFTGIGIIGASAIAAFVIGMIAVLFASLVKVPAEACLFPALLPMIPGMYAYRAIEAIIGCLSEVNEDGFNHSLYLLSYNGMYCCAIVLGMAIGANIPIFLMKRISFQATR